MENLIQSIDRVRERIARASARVRRNPEEITLVAITKSVSLEVIKAAIKYGLTAFGENKIQEAGMKISGLGNKDKIIWHMVGHLQTNKAKDAVELFDLIHSVDSVRLLNVINERAEKAGKVMNILLELNLSGEKTKYGFSGEEIFDAVNSIGKFSNVAVQGLMTMAPFSENSEDSRPYFQRLFNLGQKIKKMNTAKNIEMKFLSMGMTQDFEVAIEEGANIVRIGRAIFGER